MDPIIQAALSLQAHPARPCLSTSKIKQGTSSESWDEDFHLQNSKHSLWAHSWWIIKDYLLSFHRRERLDSWRWHKGAVPEEQEWHQTTPLGTQALSAPAQPCRTGHSSSISLYKHSLGDLHTGTEMDFLGPGTLTSEVLLQCHHQILVCSSSRNLDSPQIPVTQYFQERKINNFWHPLSLVSK